MSREGGQATSSSPRPTLSRARGVRAAHHALRLSLPHSGGLSETSIFQEATETTGARIKKGGRRETQIETAGR